MMMELSDSTIARRSTRRETSSVGRRSGPSHQIARKDQGYQHMSVDKGQSRDRDGRWLERQDRLGGVSFGTPPAYGNARSTVCGRRS